MNIYFIDEKYEKQGTNCSIKNEKMFCDSQQQQKNKV